MMLMVAEAVRRNLPGVDIVARVRLKDAAQGPNNAWMHLEMKPPRALIRRIMAAIKMPRIRYKAGAVIDIGGYQFGDPWGANYARNKAGQVKQWIRSGQPVFFLPQAWGPFSSAPIRKATTSIINTATLSFARDKKSLQELQKLVGTNHPKVRLAHDIAWNFKGEELSAGSRLMKEAGLAPKGDMLTVCLIPNLQVFKRSKGDGPQNEYILSLRDIVTHLCRVHNAQVVILKHQFVDDPSKNNDRTLCSYVLSSLDASLPVVNLDKALSAAQVKSIIGNCDLSLSSRYHALIAAMSQGVPSAAIGWSHKYDELMADIGLGSNVISLSKTKKDVLQDVDAIVERMAQAREVLKSTVPVMKQSGQNALDEVISAVKEMLQE